MQPRLGRDSTKWLAPTQPLIRTGRNGPTHLGCFAQKGPATQVGKGVHRTRAVLPREIVTQSFNDHLHRWPSHPYCHLCVESLIPPSPKNSPSPHHKPDQIRARHRILYSSKYVLDTEFFIHQIRTATSIVIIIRPPRKTPTVTKFTLQPLPPRSIITNRSNNYKLLDLRHATRALV